MSLQIDIARALTVAISAKVPVLLWGPPGSGKSSLVRSMTTAMGLPVETVIASLREPADFAGLPVVSEGGIDLAPPSWARRLAASGHGILFLDELTTAPPAVQAAVLRVVLERVVGDLALPDGVAVVAAANPPDVASGGWDLSAPLANRFCHLEWPVDPAGYVESLAAGWPTPELPDIPEHVVSQRATVQARVGGALGGFLRTRPGLVHDMPADAARNGQAWPSPRTWDMAGRLWAEALLTDAGKSVAHLLIAGCVGPGPARELLAWEQDADLPNPEEVLADPSRFRMPDRGDRQFAVLSALAAAVRADCTPERWYAAFAVIEQVVARGGPDIAAVAARSLASCMPPGIGAMPAALGALAPVMSKAGLLRRRAPAA